MTDAIDSMPSNDRISRESPQLVALLKEMKEGLDNVRSKIQALTDKVKAGNFPTSDGIGYLEAKHLLLLNYCQSLVYFLLHKAKGLSVLEHPVVRNLVEIRLFLEKIRPIDRKMQYQIQKLTNTTTAIENSGLPEKETDKTEKAEDLLKYRPNPDLLISKTNANSEDGSGVYRPPKFAPTAMEEDKMSRKEKNALRKETQMLRQANQSTYVRELMDDMEGKPEEIRENVGAESREATKYIAKMEERSRQEEELFTRAPLTKAEKQKMKHLTKSRNGLHGLTESFYDEVRTLTHDDGAPDEITSFNDAGRGERKFKKRKDIITKVAYALVYRESIESRRSQETPSQLIYASEHDGH
ncbi:Sas10/Utp3/C1D family [Perilla frutescens var. hirtella]|nr:Sas10/Utp3/C1D family [Perilla frutescens var. frutescens]KAH6786896.1 Sas10/Utp3/C1D family [Perilla frutescens var. hirtella]